MNITSAEVLAHERVKRQQTLYTQQSTSEKLEGSRLVLTTAGTDLDSTDAADVQGELKISQPVSS